MTAQQLQEWAVKFLVNLAETDEILQECEALHARLAARLGGGTWQR